jgi:uncharacterized lipoprotein
VKKGFFVKKLVWMIMASSLIGCSAKYATNDKQQYLDSHNGPALEVPPPLTRSNLSGFYELPTPDGQPQKVSVVPPKS